VNNIAKFNVSLRTGSQKRFLLALDESAYRSGELPCYRWIFPKLVPFFNNGSGQSIMISSFIVQHSQSEVFILDEEEWCNAIKAHPELHANDPILNYFSKSANALIEPEKDNYFDNLIILRQFERLFILVKLKKDFINHKIEILVDNARTHSAKVYDIN
jgi:hypothetical protein